MTILKGMKELHSYFENASSPLVLKKDKSIVNENGEVVAIYKSVKDEHEGNI